MKVISSSKPKLLCNDCNGEFHASCFKMSKADVDCLTEGELVWRCKSCESTRRKSMRLDSIVSEGTVTMEDLMKVVTEIRDSQQNYDKEYNKSFENLYAKLEESTQALKAQSENAAKNMKIMEELIVENKELKKRVTTLEQRLDEVEQYSRSNSVEIHGIPQEKNEDVLSIVKEVGVALDLNINNSMVDTCHRLRRNPNGNNPPGIIVKFVRRLDKEEFLQKRRVKRTLSTRHINRPDDRPIYINESLSPSRRRLLAKAKTVQREKQYKYCWVRNGRIFLRKIEDAEVKVVLKEEDLGEL